MVQLFLELCDLLSKLIPGFKDTLCNLVGLLDLHFFHSFLKILDLTINYLDLVSQALQLFINWIVSDGQGPVVPNETLCQFGTSPRILIW